MAALASHRSPPRRCRDMGTRTLACALSLCLAGSVAVGMCLLLLACSGQRSGVSLPRDASVNNNQILLGPPSCGGDAGSAPLACLTPATECIDAAIAVKYYFSQCDSGACVWRKQDIHCDSFEGGICIGDADSGFPTLSDGGIWGTTGPCAVPLEAPPAVPAVACDEDAGDAAAVCPPPHSVCGGPTFVLYYDNGACVAGQCTWEVRPTACPYTNCSAGACVYLGTSAPALAN